MRPGERGLYWESHDRRCRERNIQGEIIANMRKALAQAKKNVERQKFTFAKRHDRIRSKTHRRAGNHDRAG